MKRLLLALLLFALPALADDSLYLALGGKPQIQAFTEVFVDLLVADDRIKAKFEDANIPRLKRLLTEQFCALSGGPEPYTGRDMGDAHAKLALTNGDFNALVEDLQTAMDRADISFTVQNRLLALLAPMQRDVVTR